MINGDITTHNKLKHSERIMKRILYQINLDECKCFIEINLIKESCSLTETLLKPHTPGLEDKIPLVTNLISLSSFP